MSIGPDDERYRLPGTNVHNWTSYSRENIPKEPARCKVGDEVVIIGTDTVRAVYPDCDGTPLYATHNHGNGYSDDSVLLIPSGFEFDTDGPPHQEMIAALRAQGWTIEPPNTESENK